MSKFDSELAERLYEVSMVSGQDEDIGSVDELGWFGLFLKERAILEQDSEGFVSVAEFDTLAEVMENWVWVASACKEYNYDSVV